MVTIEGDLQTLDVSVLIENFLKIFVFHIFWKLSNENVVIGELVLMSTEQVFVELEGSTLLALDLEVLHFLTSVLELLRIGDAENSRVERSGVISLDLWLTLESDTSLTLEDLTEFDGCEVILWEVV